MKHNNNFSCKNGRKCSSQPFKYVDFLLLSVFYQYLWVLDWWNKTFRDIVLDIWSFFTISWHFIDQTINRLLLKIICRLIYNETFSLFSALSWGQFLLKTRIEPLDRTCFHLQTQTRCMQSNIWRMCTLLLLLLHRMIFWLHTVTPSIASKQVSFHHFELDMLCA